MLPTDPGPDPAARGEAGLGPRPGGARPLLGASSSQRGNAQVATDLDAHRPIALSGRQRGAAPSGGGAAPGPTGGQGPGGRRTVPCPSEIRPEAGEEARQSRSSGLQLRDFVYVYDEAAANVRHHSAGSGDRRAERRQRCAEHDHTGGEGDAIRVRAVRTRTDRRRRLPAGRRATHPRFARARQGTARVHGSDRVETGVQGLASVAVRSSCQSA